MKFDFLLSTFLATFIYSAVADDVVSARTFSSCQAEGAQISVSDFSFSFNKDTSKFVFNIAGYSASTQNVTATINVTAYGISAFSKSFDPCEYDIGYICPIPTGPFNANGIVPIPADIVSQIPAIAFQIPDLDGIVKLMLTGDGGSKVACLQATVGNGKTTQSTTASYATVAIAAGAFVAGGAASISAALSTASGLQTNGGFSTSPNLLDVMQWFQAVALNGALSVNYPIVYRSFTKNFAWSIGLLGWNSLQTAIDDFRGRTGGNLTASSVTSLQNSQLVFAAPNASPALSKRSKIELLRRTDGINFNTTGTINATVASSSGVQKIVTGIEAFAEQLKVPSQNTFVTILLVFLILIATIVVLCLLVKLVMEVWSMAGSFPKKADSFRRDYWRIMAGMIVRTILIIYGTWALFCLYQFRKGDSWAASLLAGVTLGIFTGVILFFTFQIVRIALGTKRLKGNAAELYDHEPHLRKYGIFYDQFKSRFWWFFIPCILYSFAKAIFIALGDGHGFVQTVGQMGCEILLLGLLFWDKPYDGRQANMVNVMISIVRIVSLVCTLIFVEGLNMAETTRTVTGVIMIVIQSLLTVILAVLILINGIMPLFRKKKLAKGQADDDSELVTPLGPYPSCTFEKNGHALGATIYDTGRNSSSSDLDDAQKLGLKTKSGYKRTPTTDSVSVFREDLYPAYESTERLVDTRQSEGRRTY